MCDISKIIAGCKKFDKKAQKILYENYAPILRAVAFRYSKNMHEAKDILHEGFLKIFKNIKKYSGKGSFEGWMKRIIINLAIDHYKKERKHKHSNLDEISEIKIQKEEVFSREKVRKKLKKNASEKEIKNAIQEAKFSSEEIMEVVNGLSKGHRLVFNLYVMEHYKHREIAEMLKISISTSKTQFMRARRLIMNELKRKLNN